MPPKPDEASPSSENSIEPLYSSINKIKNNNYTKNKNDNNERKRIKEFYEHKINGTGKIIPSVVVSGWKSAERLSSHQDFSANQNGRLISTVSLPNYDELDASRHDDKSVNNVDEKSVSRDEVDFSEELEKEVILDAGKTSTPMKENENKDSKTSVRVDGWFLNSDEGTRFPDSPASDEIKDKNESQEQKSRVQSFLYSEGSKDDLFFDAEDTKRTCEFIFLVFF